MTVRHIENVASLEKFAIEFAAELKGGEIFGLVGDLGAGKTAFVKALAKAFGVRRAVRSPTFILMQNFDLSAAAARKTGIRRLCHVDAYRLKSYDELISIGFFDLAGQPDTVAFVEWPERVPEIRRLAGYREIRFRFGEGEARTVEVDGGEIGAGK